jgi:nucleoid-associated protein YgaU
LTIGFNLVMFVYMAKQIKSGFFKSREDVVSMFLGLVVVVAVVGFIVNFIEKRKGNIDIPGVSNDLKIENVDNMDGKGETIESVTVMSGDNLWKIATRTYGDGYKWTEIAKANNIKNPNLIEAGQKLILPKVEKTSVDTVVTEKTNYVVVRGDKLWDIAIRFYGDGYKWTKIWQDNREKLNSPDQLEIGMTLVIYGKI